MAIRLDSRDLAAHPDLAAKVQAALAANAPAAEPGPPGAAEPAALPPRRERRAPGASGGPRSELPPKHDGGIVPTVERRSTGVLEGGFLRAHPWPTALVGVVLLLGGMWAGTLWMLPQARDTARRMAQQAAAVQPVMAQPAADPPAKPLPEASAPAAPAAAPGPVSVPAPKLPQPASPPSAPRAVAPGGAAQPSTQAPQPAAQPPVSQAPTTSQPSVTVTPSGSQPPAPQPASAQPTGDPGATMPLKARYFTCQVENRLGRDPWCTFTTAEKIKANLP